MQTSSSAAVRADRTVERARNAAAVLETYENGISVPSSHRRSFSFDAGSAGVLGPRTRREQSTSNVAGDECLSDPLSSWEQARSLDVGRQVKVPGARNSMLPMLAKTHSRGSFSGDRHVDDELESALNSFANVGTEQHRRLVDQRLRQANGNEMEWEFFYPGTTVVICGNDDTGVVQLYDGQEGVVISEDGGDRFLVQIVGGSELCQLSLRADNLRAQQHRSEEHDTADTQFHSSKKSHSQSSRFADIHKLAVVHAEQNAKREVQRLYQEADEQKRKIEQHARGEIFLRGDMVNRELNQLFRERCPHGKKCGKPGCKHLHPWDEGWTGRTVCGSDSKVMYKISKGIYEKHTPVTSNNRGKGGKKVQKRSQSRTNHSTKTQSPQQPTNSVFPRSTAEVPNGKGQQHSDAVDERAGVERMPQFVSQGEDLSFEKGRPRVLPTAGSARGTEQIRSDSRNALALPSDRIQFGAHGVVLPELNDEHCCDHTAQIEAQPEAKRGSSAELAADEEDRQERIKRLVEQKKRELREKKKLHAGDQASPVDVGARNPSNLDLPHVQSADFPSSHLDAAADALPVSAHTPSQAHVPSYSEPTADELPHPQRAHREEDVEEQPTEDQEERRRRIQGMIEVRKMELRRGKAQAENDELHALLQKQRLQQLHTEQSVRPEHALPSHSPDAPCALEGDIAPRLSSEIEAAQASQDVDFSEGFAVHGQASEDPKDRQAGSWWSSDAEPAGGSPGPRSRGAGRTNSGAGDRRQQGGSAGGRGPCAGAAHDNAGYSPSQLPRPSEPASGSQRHRGWGGGEGHLHQDAVRESAAAQSTSTRQAAGSGAAGNLKEPRRRTEATGRAGARAAASGMPVSTKRAGAARGAHRDGRGQRAAAAGLGTEHAAAELEPERGRLRVAPGAVELFT